MTISIRLDARLEREVERVAEQAGISKSELVRRSLVKYLAEHHERPSAWELGKDLFGRVGGGRPDLSTNRKKILGEILRAKQNRR